MRFSHPLTLSFVLLVAGCPGCPDGARPDAGARDASVDARRDAGFRAQRRRRRGARGVSLDARTRSHASLASEGVSEGLEETDELPAARPRITETGPMLPEELGPPPEVSYDMNTAGEGPLGPTEAQVRRAFEPLLPRLGNCAAATTDDQGHGPHGRVRVRMRVRNDGRPVAAQVSGGGGPAAFVTCVRRVLASARFEPFRGPDAIVGWAFDVD